MKSWMLACLFPGMAWGQDYVRSSERPASSSAEWNLGLGIGFDYGGLGVQAQCRPMPHLALFGGAGYAIIGAGWNAGAMGRILPDARWCPYVIAMYGYNAVIKVEGASEYDKLYYGPTLGIGTEMHRRDNDENFWRFEVLLPLRDPAFQDDIDALRRNPLIKMGASPPDIGIGVGYHFGL